MADEKTSNDTRTGSFFGFNALYETNNGNDSHTDVFFNDGNPLGAGHGHAVIDDNKDGGVTFFRDIGDNNAQVNDK